MYENMVDVLIYLYENYMDGEGQPPVNQSELEDELAQAGFSNPEIEKALRWLDELAAGADTQYQDHKVGSIRIYVEDECAKLDLEARGFLVFLEQSGILDPASRELVIERALAIDHPVVAVDEAQVGRAPGPAEPARPRRRLHPDGRPGLQRRPRVSALGSGE